MDCNEIMKRDDFKKAVDFHGHFCPGLAIGYRAAGRALEYFGEGRSEDEDLVAVVENDACGVDAVQALTGCTFGKGNLIHKDYGKQVFYFFTRNSGKAIRISMKNSVLQPTEEQKAIAQKVRSGSAGAEERERFANMQRDKACRLLEIPFDQMFTLEETGVPVPEKARIMASEPCGRCGEPTMVTKLKDVGGVKVCLECLDKSGGK